MSLQYHGTIKIPKGVIKAVEPNQGWGTAKKAADRAIRLPQGELPVLFGDILFERIKNLCGSNLQEIVQERNWLFYSQVEPHRDEPSFASRGKRILFLHVVLSGESIIKTKRKKIAVKRGDIFSFNPQELHEVPSKTYCLTACYTIIKKSLTGINNEPRCM